MRALLLVALLIVAGLAGCSRSAPPSWPSPTPPPFAPAGEWEKLASWPGSSNYFATTNQGIIVVSPDYHNPGPVPAKVFLWREGTSEFEKLFEFGGMIAVGSIGDSVFVFRDANPVSYRENAMVIERYHIPTKTFATDRDAADDRVGTGIANSAQAVTVGDTIYLFGGCCGKGHIYAYDTTKMTFKKVTAIPRGESESYLTYYRVTWDGESFLLPPPGAPAEGDRRTIDAYHLATGTWSTVGAYPIDRGGGTIFHDADTYWALAGNCLYRLNESTGIFEGYHRLADNHSNHQMIGGIEWKGEYYVYLRNLGDHFLARWTPPAVWPPPDLVGDEWWTLCNRE